MNTYIPTEKQIMEANQKRCIKCANYNVDSNNCKLEECKYCLLRYNPNSRSRFKRSSKDIYKDLQGNRVD